MEALNSLNPNAADVLTLGILFGSLFVFGIVTLLAYQWRLARESEHAAALKQQMLDKGFTADDIVRAIEARPGGKAGVADKA